MRGVPDRVAPARHVPGHRQESMDERDEARGDQSSRAGCREPPSSDRSGSKPLTFPPIMVHGQGGVNMREGRTWIRASCASGCERSGR